MRNAFAAVVAGVLALFNVQSTSASSDIASQLEAMVQKASHELGVQINLAGKQRMLTQKMSKEALLIALGMDVKENLASLRKTIALFEKTLIGLEKGDSSLGLVPTTKDDIIAQLHRVGVLWKDFKPLVMAVANGNVDKGILLQISQKNLPLLSEMNKAVKMYERASGADTAELAVVINLSGRQRMLTQKMTKEYLLIALGVDREKNARNLKKTMALFDRTLKGLVDGDEEQELPGTTDAKIRAQLKIVMGLWNKFQPLLEMPAAPETLKAVAKANLPLLAEMNKAVKMYEESW